MTKNLEVVQFRKRGDKWRATRLGYAKKNDKGQLNIYLDALPLPDGEGNVRMVVQTQQPRDVSQDRQSDTQASNSGFTSDEYAAATGGRVRSAGDDMPNDSISF